MTADILTATAADLEELKATVYRYTFDILGLRDEKAAGAASGRDYVTPLVEMLLDEESQHLAGLSDFIGKPISLSTEPSFSPEQYDIVLM